MAGVGMHGRVGQAEQGRSVSQGNAGIALQGSAGRTDRPGMQGRAGQPGKGRTAREGHGRASRPGRQGRAVQASLAVRAKYASHVGRACEAGKAVEDFQAAW